MSKDRAMSTMAVCIKTNYRLLTYRMTAVMPLAVLLLVVLVSNAGLRSIVGDFVLESSMLPADLPDGNLHSMRLNEMQTTEVDRSSLLAKISSLERRLDVCERKLQRLTAAGSLLNRFICTSRSWQHFVGNGTGMLLQNVANGGLSEGIDDNTLSFTSDDRQVIANAIRVLRDSAEQPSNLKAPGQSRLDANSWSEPEGAKTLTFRVPPMLKVK